MGWWQSGSIRRRLGANENNLAEFILMELWQGRERWHNVLTTPQLLPPANNNGNAEYAILNLLNESHCSKKKEINIAGDYLQISQQFLSAF